MFYYKLVSGEMTVAFIYYLSFGVAVSEGNRNSGIWAIKIGTHMLAGLL